MTGLFGRHFSVQPNTSLVAMNSRSASMTKFDRISKRIASKNQKLSALRLSLSALVKDVNGLKGTIDQLRGREDAMVRAVREYCTKNPINASFFIKLREPTIHKVRRDYASKLRELQALVSQNAIRQVLCFFSFFFFFFKKLFYCRPPSRLSRETSTTTSRSSMLFQLVMTCLEMNRFAILFFCLFFYLFFVYFLLIFCLFFCPRQTTSN